MRTVFLPLLFVCSHDRRKGGDSCAIALCQPLRQRDDGGTFSSYSWCVDRLGLGFLWSVVLVSTVMAAALNKGAPDLFPAAWVRKSSVDLETGFPIEAGMAATAALWFVFYSSFAAAVRRAPASLWSLGAFTGALRRRCCDCRYSSMVRSTPDFPLSLSRSPAREVMFPNRWCPDTMLLRRVGSCGLKLSTSRSRRLSFALDSFGESAGIPSYELNFWRSWAY